MNPRIGLFPPLLALLGFALIFNPWVIPKLPSRGYAGVFVSPQIFFLAASLMIVVYRRLKPVEIGLGVKSFRRNLLLGFGVGLIPALLVMGSAFIGTAFDRVWPFLERPLFGGEAIPANFPAPRLWTLLLVAPVCEEIFFRGILLKALRESHSATFAVILSAVIFMAGHGGVVPGPLMLGLITGPLMLATGSVIPGIVFHAVSNAYGPILIGCFPNLYRLLAFLFQ